MRGVEHPRPSDALVIRLIPPSLSVADSNQLTLRRVCLQTKPESLFTNIVVDIRDGQCDDAFAYAADVFRYGLLVYSWREDRSYRLSHNLFFPDPIASRYVTWTRAITNESTKNTAFKRRIP